MSVPGATHVCEHDEMELAMTGSAPVTVVRDQLVLGPVTVSLRDVARSAVAGRRTVVEEWLGFSLVC